MQLIIVKKERLPPLDTYSIDYVDNDKTLLKAIFQPNSDNYYINLMNKNLHTNHHQIVIDTFQNLLNILKMLMIARDMPGAPDIDSSYSCLQKCKKEMTVSLTGECADERFLEAILGFP